MDKREKVIKGLECCSVEQSCLECPWQGKDCNDRLHLAALELLKEQEAVEPETEILNEIDRIYRCSKCHKAFFYRNQKYCDRCGQKVKWND